MKPQDYYFAVGVDAENQDINEEYGEKYGIDYTTTIAYIVPISFWNNNHYMKDQHLNIDDILPEYMSECMESHFDSPKSPEETKQDLLQLGFVESPDFYKFLNGLGVNYV